MKHVLDKALTLNQVIRRRIAKLFRVEVIDAKIRQILDTAAAQNFRVLEADKSGCKLKSSVNLSGLHFILRKGSSDLLVFNQVILNLEYSPLVQLVDKYLARDEVKVIVDAGANIGLTSLYLSSFFKNADCYAIEPVNDNFAALRRNVSANRDLRILPLQNALWSESRKLGVSEGFRDRQAWSMQVKPEDYGEASIDGLTLSQIKNKNGFQNIDIFKMDIEGAEAVLFKSLDFLSELRTIKFIAIELHEEAVDKIQVINLLQELGFTLTYKGETLFGVNLPAIQQMKEK